MSETGPAFTIKVVAERTGIPVHTLRAWERRYGVPKPRRNEENRYRLYGEQDVADVLWLKHQVESGISPAQASAILRHDRRPAAPITPGESAQPLEASRAALQHAFARSDPAGARQVLDEAFALFSPEQAVLAIISPAMEEIGNRWMRNEMTVWQEHLASNTIQQKLAAVMQAQPSLSGTAPTVVAACAPNEQHAVGLLAFSLLARRQGWRVALLGQSTPLADLRALSLRTKPEVIGVSMTTVVGLAGLIPWLDPAHRPPAKLVFGGRLLNLSPGLREHLPGEYLGQDALAAAQALTPAKSRRVDWSPSPRAWRAAETLSALRLKVAGDTVAQWVSTRPPRFQGAWNSADSNQATLFLVDALLSAVAFDAPDLMDLERKWLEEAMPPRLVSVELLWKHIETVAQVLQRLVPKEQYRLYEPLLDRMKPQPITRVLRSNLDKVR